MFVLSLLSSLALAADAPKTGMTLDVPTLGVTLVSKAGCDFTILGTVPARKAGELAKALSDAKSQCLESQARVAQETRRGVAATLRAPGEAALLASAGTALEGGHNVRVKTPEGLEVSGGDHLNWDAYATATRTADSRLYAPGVVPSGGDPNLYRLSGGQTGYLVTPTVTGQQIVPASAPVAANADCGTSFECQETINAQSAVMDNSDE